jgi:hypothetical protein
MQANLLAVERKLGLHHGYTVRLCILDKDWCKANEIWIPGLLDYRLQYKVRDPAKQCLQCSRLLTDWGGCEHSRITRVIADTLSSCPLRCSQSVSL